MGSYREINDLRRVPGLDDLEATTTVDHSGGGRFTEVTVTAVNEVGDGIGRVGRLSLVPPFGSVPAFVAPPSNHSPPPGSSSTAPPTPPATPPEPTTGPAQNENTFSFWA